MPYGRAPSTEPAPGASLLGFVDAASGHFFFRAEVTAAGVEIRDLDGAPVGAGSIAAMSEAASLFAEVGDRQGFLVATLNLGLTERESGNIDAALAAYRRVVSGAAEIGDAAGYGASTDGDHLIRTPNRPAQFV